METYSPAATKKLKICVGLSGGVDSSVTAALLKQQGHEVIGVYMKNWNDESPTLGDRPLEPAEYRMDCPWYDDYLDAKRVAMHLNIPFTVWDFREAYKQKVFDAFITEFEKGRTPNPDIYCNSRVKFEDFQQRALTELNADYVATGHYARVERVGDQFVLSQPKDAKKDQTYFLYRLTQAQLSHALFPLAGYTKSQVRELAVQFDLPTKYRKDSQGICFVGDVEVRQLVSQWLAPKTGDIVDEAGQVLGQHQGMHLYTIGEKMPVDNQQVALHYPELKHEIPHFYVAEKDVDANRLVVVPGAEHTALYKQQITLEELHWIGSAPAAGQKVLARLRHGGRLLPVSKIELPTVGCAQLTLEQPERAVAPGQHLVLYTETGEVLGGGVMTV